MKKYYKSTIVIYSDSDWSNDSLSDLITDATVVGQVGGSICSTWDIDEIDEKGILSDPNSSYIIKFFNELEEIDEEDDYEDFSQYPEDIDIDPDPYLPYPEEEYEFYDEDK